MSSKLSTEDDDSKQPIQESKQNDRGLQLTDMEGSQLSIKSNEPSSPVMTKSAKTSSSNLVHLEEQTADAAEHDPLGMARKSFFFSDGGKKKIKFKRAKKLHRAASLEYFNMTKDLQASRFSVRRLHMIIVEYTLFNCSGL